MAYALSHKVFPPRKKLKINNNKEKKCLSQFSVDVFAHLLVSLHLLRVFLAMFCHDSVGMYDSDVCKSSSLSLPIIRYFFM